MKIEIPNAIIDKLNRKISLDIDFYKAPETVKQKVFKACINIWYLIFNAQVSDEKCLTLNYYTHISSRDLDVKEFTLKYNCKRYSYSKFISILKPDLIAVNDNYRFALNGESHTKSYRVHKSFIRKNEFKTIEIDFKPLMRNNRNKSYWIKKYPDYTELISDSYRTKIDLLAYIKWLHENEGLVIDEKSITKHFSKDGKEIQYSVIEERVLDAERIMRYTNSAIKHNIGNLWFKISDEGRFYSSLTNLSKTAIPFYLLNKRKLESIDISNSQPLLLATMVNNDQYKEDCGAGVFYKKLIDKTGSTKNKIKNLLYKYVFFTDKPLKGGALYKILEELYPGLVDQINILKETISLAHHLQRMEANIIVEGAGRLDFPKLLRHDQVLMYEEHYKDVAEYLRLEYQKLELNVHFK